MQIIEDFKDLMLHFFLGRPPFPMPESFADLGPVPEFTAAPRKKQVDLDSNHQEPKYFRPLSTRGSGPLPC